MSQFKHLSDHQIKENFPPKTTYKYISRENQNAYRVLNYIKLVQRYTPRDIIKDTDLVKEEFVLPMKKLGMEKDEYIQTLDYIKELSIKLGKRDIDGTSFQVIEACWPKTKKGLPPRGSPISDEETEKILHILHVNGTTHFGLSRATERCFDSGLYIPKFSEHFTYFTKKKCLICSPKIKETSSSSLGTINVSQESLFKDTDSFNDNDEFNDSLSTISGDYNISSIINTNDNDVSFTDSIAVVEVTNKIINDNMTPKKVKITKTTDHNKNYGIKKVIVPISPSSSTISSPPSHNEIRKSTDYMTYEDVQKLIFDSEYRIKSSIQKAFKERNRERKQRERENNESDIDFEDDTPKSVKHKDIKDSHNFSHSCLIL